MRKIVYTGPAHGRDVVAEQVGPEYSVVLAEATPQSIGAHMREADAVLDASMRVPIRGEVLDAAARLRIIVTATTGADHIDSAALEKRGIPLLTLKGQHDVLRELTPAAELSWLLLMACARKLRPAIRHVEEGGWNRELFPGVMLNGKTLGVVGCGRLGKWMARYANAFGMQVLGFDPHNSEWPAHLRPVTLDELLRESHFVSIHVHLSDETRGMLGASQLAQVKRGAILINTSRGAVVDEDALIAALDDGRIAAFGADVLEGEPDIQKTRLWQYAQSHPDCVITPHIGGFSPDALAVVLRFSAQRIADFFQN